jgi:hypothetical protein
LNQKKVVRTVPNPTYLHAIDIDVENKGRITGHRVVSGQCVDLHNRKGSWVFRYAERAGDTLLIYVEQYGKRRTVREADIRHVVGSR